MKKFENTFAVSGFVGRDAEIRQFANTSVARFSLAVGRPEESGDESPRGSASMTKGSLITVEGHFKPEEWNDADGVKHNRVILVATRFYPTADKEQKAEKQEKES